MPAPRSRGWRDVEGDCQAFAFGEGSRAMPHDRREKDETSRLRLDQAEGRKIEVELRGRLAKCQPARGLWAPVVEGG